MKKEIKVALGNRSYPILIENGLLPKCGAFVRKITAAPKIALLSTPAIYKAWGRELAKSLQRQGIRLELILISDGEKNKNERVLFRILKTLALRGFQKDGCLIALGGGVIGDLGGLAASLYMRGIGFIQCPTTLLAQVDASIGGKTAVDFAGIKNLVGTYHQPQCVLVDPQTLRTLDERQFKTGLAEVIKYGVIQDEALFGEFEDHPELIQKRDPQILLRLISKSCGIKARIVSEDEREGGKRAWLNYGHTLGHALEAYFHYGVLTHGEAVAYGMWFAAMLSHQLCLCPENVLQRQRSVLKRMGLLQKLPYFNPGKIYQKMFLDKKARKGRIQFILTRKIGLVTIQKNVPQPIILSALTQLRVEASKRR